MNARASAANKSEDNLTSWRKLPRLGCSALRCWMNSGCEGTRDNLAVGLGLLDHVYMIWDSPAQAVPASMPWGSENAWEASMHVYYLLFDIFPLMLLS